MAASLFRPFSRLVIGVGLAAAVSGCAISSPPQITNSVSTAQAITDFAWVPSGEQSELRARFAQKLESELLAENVRPAASSRWVADYSIAIMPSGVSTAPVSKSAPPSADALKSASLTKWYHKCKPDTVQGKLVVYDMTNNTIAASAEGEFVACPGDISNLDGLAKQLVSSALGQSSGSKAQE